MIIHGDSLEVLRTLEPNSVDAVCTDPPYGLAFMNKHWDYSVPKAELWREVFRVMKPGAHLLSFGGTRTYHRMVVEIEDAGFEIRDQVQWIYGSGFPKSLDVSKALDKAAGAEREIVGENPNTRGRISKIEGGSDYGGFTQVQNSGVTAPATPDAKRWQGWGTALKPACEPIVLARKPLEKGLTVAQNVEKWGVGALNIDGTRIPVAADEPNKRRSTGGYNSGESLATVPNAPYNSTRDATLSQGRWPANVLLGCGCLVEEREILVDGVPMREGIHHGDCAVGILDEQSGVLKSGELKGYHIPGASSNGHLQGKATRLIEKSTVSSGGASRFFYVAKASKRERNAGLEGMPEISQSNGNKWTDVDYRVKRGERPPSAQSGPRANHHPTVKPIKLMEYLCKLITPPNGLVLDPFAGSGSTGVAATRLGFRFIGIEREAEYVTIAERRIAHAEQECVQPELGA